MANVQIRTSGMKTKNEEAFTGPACPGCGQPTLPGSHYCYKCDHFLDPTGSRVLKCGEVSMQELEQLMRRSELSQQRLDQDPGTKMTQKTLLYGVLGMIAGAVIVLFGGGLLGAAVMIISLVASVIITNKVSPPTPPDIIQGDHFVGLVAHYVTPYVLSGLFDSVEVYDPKGHITSQFINSTGLIYRDYNVISGSHYIRGVYHGVPVELSNVHLQYRTEDEDGKASYSEAFEGVFMICNFGTRVAAPIVIHQRRRGMHMKHEIHTDHEAFNKRFLVSCTDEAEAFRFLTPHAMEQILRVDQLIGGRTYMLVMTDGRVVIGMDSKRTIMRTQDPAEPFAQIRDRMENDLQYPLSLVDTLNSAHLNR